MRVVVLAGGLSHERDVSLRSGRRVAEALREADVEVVVHDIDSDLLPFLAEARPDVVWPLIHGVNGEDGSVRDILEVLGLPYVGSDPRASRLAWNKPVAKSILSRAGVVTPAYVTLPQSLFRELGARQVLEEVGATLGFPLAVKPSRGGSALGVTMVDRPEDLAGAVVSAFSYGDIVLFEQAVRGTEVAVAVAEDDEGTPRALPAVEVLVTDGPYDYDARYNPGRTQYFVPARLSPEQAGRVAEVAVAVHRELGLTHLSRMDAIVDTGEVHFLEVNVAPGMTETSLFPQAVVAAGESLPSFYRALIARAAGLERGHAGGSARSSRWPTPSGDTVVGA